MIKGFKELIVWQKAMDAAAEVYRLAKCLPREELQSLGNQMRRAAVSVPSNIAEGFGRASKKDYANFLVIARGSLFEIETKLLLCSRVGYLAEAEIRNALSLIAEVGRMINAILPKLRPESAKSSPRPAKSHPASPPSQSPPDLPPYAGSPSALPPFDPASFFSSPSISFPDPWD